MASRALPQAKAAVPGRLSHKEERELAAIQFRRAYSLHLTYTGALLLTFLCGAFDPTFRVASYVLGPGFVAVLAIRVALHYQADMHWAQSVGTWLLCCAECVPGLDPMLFRV